MADLLIAGLASGALYALVGVALVVIYRASGVLNFAQGDMATIILFVAYFLLVGQGLPYPVVIPAVLAFAVLQGALVYLLVVRPVQNRPALTVIMATFGVSLILNAVVVYLFGGEARGFPAALTGPNFELGPFVLSPQRALTIGVAIGVMVLGYVIFNRSRAGLIVRAAYQNRSAAVLMGVRVKRLMLGVWVTSAVLGVVAALLLAPLVRLSSGVMNDVLLIAFAAVVIGGLTSPAGAVVGGMLIGIGQAAIAAYLTLELQATFMFVVILAVLMLRPQGLLGTRDTTVEDHGVGEAAGRRSRRSSPCPGLVGGLERVRRSDSVRAAVDMVTWLPARLAMVPSRFYAIAVLGAVLVIPMLVPVSFEAAVAVQVAALVPAVISVTVLSGVSGQLSVGQAGFVAVGAYATALLNQHTALDGAIVVVVSALLACGFGAAMGLPAIRVSGPYLALITLAFSWAVPEILVAWDSVTGGYAGTYVADATMFGIAIGDTVTNFYVIIPLVAVLVYGSHRLLRSEFARKLRAVRDSEPAAAAVGLDPARYKILAFTISAGFAGVAGSLLAYSVGFIAPETFTVYLSIYLLLAAVLGGIESVAGAVLGATFITVVPIAAGSAGAALPQVVFGASLLALILFLPGGLASIASRLRLRASRSAGTSTGGSGGVSASRVLVPKDC
ncbi:MAG: hypothetical protein GEU74_16490 [Nitriliruptorales bacterium]|nr:hypothetical protein [Nitriliruptorales bacterium]